MTTSRHTPSLCISLTLTLLLAACTTPADPAIISVSVTVADDELLVGQSAQATAQVSRVGGADASVDWSSTDDGVVTVDVDGTVTAVAPGVAEVVAISVFDPSKSDSVTVEVLVTWESLPSLPVPVSRPAAAFLDGLVYLIGGESDGGDKLGQVQAYDPVAESWDTSLPATPVGLSNACAVALDGAIYLFGGWTGQDEVDTLYRLEPGAGPWEELALDVLPSPRLGAACVVHAGKVYLIGGSDDEDQPLEPWTFDPALAEGSRWTTGLANTAVTGGILGGAVSVGDYIYYGGATGINSTFLDADWVVRYDPALDEWASLPDLQVPRGGAGLWAVGDLLYVAGGGWQTFLNSVEVYDLSEGLTGTWSVDSYLAQGRRSFGLAVDPVSQTAYAAGGWAGELLGNVESRNLAPNP